MLRSQYLSWVVHQTIVRAFNRYLFLMKDTLHVSSNIYKCDYCCDTFVPLFINLRHPRDFTSQTSRRGTLYYYEYVQMCFLAHRHFFLFRPRVFSHALGCVARREPALTPRRKFGPWPRSVARALEVQSSKSPRGVIPST